MTEGDSRHEGKDENVFEWSPANILFARYAVDWGPTGQLRMNASCQLQQYNRIKPQSLSRRLALLLSAGARDGRVRDGFFLKFSYLFRL